MNAKQFDTRQSQPEEEPLEHRLAGAAMLRQQRRTALSSHHNAVHLLVTVAILAFALVALSSTAQGANAGTERMRLGTEADFGSGAHVFGTPDWGTIKWDFTPEGGRVRVTARVQGKLYLDKIGEGCARLIVNFQDEDSNNISSRTIQFCGPGNNANSPDNQRTIDVSSGGLFDLRRVQLVVGEGPTLGQIVDEEANGTMRPTLHKNDTINNGEADFGAPPHALGTPVSNANISLVLNAEGRVVGNVRGTLFWDSFGSGCARLVINFRDANNNNLGTRTINQCGPTGGNANSNSNQSAIDRTFARRAV
jgi:hypothetical protein